MQQTIRQLGSMDANTFAKLRLAGLRDSPLSFGSSYVEECERTAAEWADFLQNNFYLGFYIQEELVGMVGLAFCNLKKLSHTASLRGLFVAAKYRRRGIAKQLVTAAEQAALEHKAEQICLTATAGNLVTEQFYASLGYKKYGTEPRALKVDGQYFDDDLYIKFLQP